MIWIKSLFAKCSLEAIEDVTRIRGEIGGFQITLPMCINLDDVTRDQIVYIMTGLPPHSNLSEHRIKPATDLKKRFEIEVARLRWRHESLQGNFIPSHIAHYAEECGWQKDQTIVQNHGIL